MSRLIQAGDRFKAVYKTIEGRQFHGQILEPPDTSRVSNFLSARRYLRTSPKAVVQPRDVINVANQLYVVAEHGSGFYVIPIYRHYKLFEVDYIADGFRSYTVKNTITGVKEIKRDQPMGKVHLSLQPTASDSDALMIPQEVKIAISNKPLEVEDIVGKYIVIKSDIVLGVTLVEIKEL